MLIKRKGGGGYSPIYWNLYKSPKIRKFDIQFVFARKNVIKKNQLQPYFPVSWGFDQLEQYFENLSPFNSWFPEKHLLS